MSPKCGSPPPLNVVSRCVLIKSLWEGHAVALPWCSRYCELQLVF